MTAFASSLFVRPFHNSVIQFYWTTALKKPWDESFWLDSEEFLPIWKPFRELSVKIKPIVPRERVCRTDSSEVVFKFLFAVPCYFRS